MPSRKPISILVVSSLIVAAIFLAPALRADGDIAAPPTTTEEKAIEDAADESGTALSSPRQSGQQVDVRKLLKQADEAGRLPAGVVGRVWSQMLWKAGTSKEDKSSEAWEFTSDKVHRIVRGVKGNSVIYRRDKSLPFDSERLCRELADGRILEIRDNKGAGEPVRFALALEGYDQGERSIEILVDETPVIRLGESHLSPGYLEPHARNFATLYEKLASQAQAVFAEPERKARETLLEAARKGIWPKGMVVRVGADAFHPHKDWKLVENWEFTDGEVHQIVLGRSDKDEIVRRREKSLPFDTSKICKHLVNGRAFEIHVSDSIEQGLLLADHEGAVGGRSIEVMIGDEYGLELGEHCTGALYGVTQAHAFARLYERLASQARAAFAVVGRATPPRRSE